MASPAPERNGIASVDSKRDDGTDRRINPLANHAAIRHHGSGVASSELADFIMSVARMAASRVEGIGDEQYGGMIQKFELMSSEEIFQSLLEEVADIFSYASFLAIKAGALR